MTKKEPCPATLGGTDRDSVYEWLYEVEKGASASSTTYAVEDLCSFVSKFFPENSKPYNQVVEIIREYYGEDVEPEKPKVDTRRRKKSKVKVTKPRWQDDEYIDGPDVLWDEKWDDGKWDWSNHKVEEDLKHPVRQKAHGAKILSTLPQIPHPVESSEEMIGYKVDPS